MSAELINDGVILLGSILGAATVTLIPYFQKIREVKKIDGSELKFDKKFLYTALIAFVLGTVVSLLNYSTVEAQVDENQTLLKIFVTAFGIAFTANWIFNSVLKPSSLVGVVNVLQGENEALKSKVASLSAQKTQ
jgi:hypothetical protein